MTKEQIELLKQMSRPSEKEVKDLFPDDNHKMILSGEITLNDKVIRKIDYTI